MTNIASWVGSGARALRTFTIQEKGVATEATEQLLAQVGYRVTRYTQYRDRDTGQYIREQDAKLLPPRRVVSEQRTLVTPEKASAPEGNIEA